MPQVDVRINNKGLRGKREYPYEKPVGKKRIMLLGDSIAFGYGLSEEDTISARLPGISNGSSEVINAGVIAYGTDHETHFFDEGISIYEFDVLLLAFSINDIY